MRDPFAVIIGTLLLACSSKPTPASAPPPEHHAKDDALDDARRAILEASDVAHARELATAYLADLEARLAAAPDDGRVRSLLAEASCGFAFGFVQGEVEELRLSGEDPSAAEAQATDLYRRCAREGLALLGWGDALAEDTTDQLDARLAATTAADLPGLFWTAFGTAAAAHLHRDDIELVAQLPAAKRLFERVLELDPDMAGAHVALGMLATSVSQALGGDPRGGKAHFEQASDDGVLLPRVLMARAYGVVAQDQQVFHDVLTEVVEAPLERWPDRRLVNELAKRRAQLYLAHEADLFY